MAKKFKTTDHLLIPKHSKCSIKEKEEVFAKYQVEDKQLPRILKNDPGLENLDVKAGDLIKITRKSPTTGESLFYRVVISE